MEQPSTRSPQRNQRKVRRGSPVPRPAAPVGERGNTAAARAGRGPAPLPAARLTGLGSGLLTALAMLGIGVLDARWAHSSPHVYGLFFLLGSAACALWVRPADLMTAPVSAPIAFAVGAVPISGGGGGFAGRLMNLVTLLSLHAGWLYSGTLLAAVIALVRRIVLIRTRRRVRPRKRPSQPPRSPRCSPDERARYRR
ncbi:hypothetical protein FHS39_000532 [Streptomyces olivoverticillatus]|uniref:DUF6542 domain-containing protein n=1 Tax=Streptomyces olivoverticillatus TaxID=66427 RepID=A0A7W7LKK9_9ACTN|nr:DUF6542 domain-containing protein [Streptomyces olivoverticillatus]MBB4891532.1 hypothetical protein [Streptomyces olivoverticillatus]